MNLLRTKKQKERTGQSKKVFLSACIFHFAVSLICSLFFFHPIIEHAGFENIAYKWLFTGISMEYDTLARFTCVIYSFLLASLMIYCLWRAIFYFNDTWRRKSLKAKVYIICLCIIELFGILVILAIYPRTVSNAPDTAYNYVYAKEWMPMYWHGFLTNVFHCACMIVFPHPAAMSVVPFIFGCSASGWLIYEAIIRHCKYGIVY